MIDSTTLKKGDEVCVTIVGWIDSFTHFPNSDFVLHVVDMEGNMHSISLVSSTTTLTKLTKGE